MSQYNNGKIKEENARIFYNSRRAWENNKEMCRYENKLARERAQRTRSNFFKQLNKKSHLANNRGGIAPVVVGGLFMIVIIAIVFTIVIVVSRDNNNGNNEGEGRNSSIMDLFLETTDTSENPSVNIEANYLIFINDTKIKEGKTNKNSLVQYNLGTTHPIKVYCWNDKYYLAESKKSFQEREILENKSRVTCTPTKSGEIQIDHISGGLINLENKLVYNVSSDNGVYNGLQVCFAWSAGILNARLEKNEIYCNEGIWKNYSTYNIETQTYEYLPEDTYLCGLTNYQECELVESTKCHIKQYEIPIEYQGIVDECYFTGKTLNQNEITLEMTVEMLEVRNSLDYLEIYFIDTDKRFYDSIGWKRVSEFDGRDLGAENKEITLTFENLEGGN